VTAISLRRRFLELLLEVEFSERYFVYYESHRNIEDLESNVSMKDMEDVLSQTKLNFVYNKRERFFFLKEACGNSDLQFGVALLYRSSLELTLYLNSSVGVLGDPFPKLAREVGQLFDPDFTYNPLSPKLPVSCVENLREAVEFGVSLFQDARCKLCSFDGWRKDEAKKLRNKEE
jgi:hypothetical protein